MPDNTTTIVTKDKNRAQGRWKLLRNAILRDGAGASNQQHSIHAFTGYKMLKTTATIDGKDEIVKQLHIIKHASELEVSLLALLAIEPTCANDQGRVVFEFTVLDKSINELTVLNDLLSKSKHILWEYCLCEWKSDNTLVVELQINDRAVQCFAAQLYLLDDKNKQTPCVLMRHRSVPIFSWRTDLTSHRHTVDHTGNVCVWDSELTLAWALAQQHHDDNISQTKLHTVTEVGAGMAGIAALSLAPRCQTMYLTDGHVDCVLNNRVHVRLMMAANMLRDDTNVHCQELVWSMTPHNVPPQRADLTLVSDCTHFEDLHAALFATLLECTRAGGTIWACQPDRGLSLQLFLQLVHVLNSTCCSPLVTISERRYQQLDRMHEQFVLESDKNGNNIAYDANRHFPRIFCFTKLRDMTPHDKEIALLQIKERTNAG
jgi:hypothetical protein